MAQADDSDPGMQDTGEPDFTDEIARQTAYANQQFEQAAAAVAVKPPYNETSATYKIYEIAGSQDQFPQILTFSVASGTRTTGTRNFRSGSDVTYRVVEWTAVRRDDWPKIPAVDESAGPLVSRKVFPHAPNVQYMDGTLLFKISGKYVYVLNTPLADTADVAVPQLPNTDYSEEEGTDAVTSDDQDADIAPA